MLLYLYIVFFICFCLRPPVIRPPVIRPPATSTELPKFEKSEEPHDLTATAVAIDPQLVANLDDLDDDY